MNNNINTIVNNNKVITYFVSTTNAGAVQKNHNVNDVVKLNNKCDIFNALKFNSCVLLCKTMFFNQLKHDCMMKCIKYLNK